MQQFNRFLSHFQKVWRVAGDLHGVVTRAFPAHYEAVEVCFRAGANKRAVCIRFPVLQDGNDVGRRLAAAHHSRHHPRRHFVVGFAIYKAEAVVDGAVHADSAVNFAAVVHRFDSRGGERAGDRPHGAFHSRRLQHRVECGNGYRQQHGHHGEHHDHFSEREACFLASEQHCLSPWAVGPLPALQAQ